jgi:hypothetical protein
MKSRWSSDLREEKNLKAFFNKRRGCELLPIFFDHPVETHTIHREKRSATNPKKKSARNFHFLTNGLNTFS